MAQASRVRRVLPCVFAGLVTLLPAQINCSWTQGLFPLSGVDGAVYAQTVWDDGSGPALYVGGAFGIAGGVIANRIAKWDGSAWTALGTGLDGEVRALAVHDDGNGAALFAGGTFTTAGGIPASRIARWDGSSRSALGAGLDGAVNALATYSNGSAGAALFAGGTFQTAGGVAAPGIAIWFGATWSDIAGSVTAGPGDVRALRVHDDGTGVALYAGGALQSIGGVATGTIARWNGVFWSAIGAGIPTTWWGATVVTLVVFDDGSGPALHAGGSFGFAPPGPTSPVARWNGATWSFLGTAIGQVGSLEVFDAGSGPRLYASGAISFPASPGQLLQWSGTTWVGVASVGGVSNSRIRSLLTLGAGPAARLIAGGEFLTAGNRVARNVAAFDGSSWSVVGEERVPFEVKALAVFDDGTGPELWISGWVPNLAPVAPYCRLLRWDGQAWTDSGAGLDYGVQCFRVWDDGSGPALYAGGSFTQIGGIQARGIARWNGTTWSPLGSGFQNTTWPGIGTVAALAVFDDGTGPALYAGGTFTTTGGAPVVSVARWSGTSWGPVGSGLWSHQNYPQNVRALAVHDDGTGPALYAAGEFFYSGTIPNQVPAGNIARWNGAAWSMVGSPTTLPVIISGTALAVHDDGAGPRLFLGAHFSALGATDVAGVLRWSGSQWTTVGGTMTGYLPYAPAFTLASLDDGTGRALYAGMSYANTSGVPLNGLGRWDGTAWTAVGGGFSGSGSTSRVNALTLFDAGNGPALYAGGWFTASGGVPSANLAEWRCTGPGLIVDQAGGPGAPVSVANVRLVTGVETFNVFSASPCTGVPGGGPLLGLCAPDPAPLLAQILSPLGAAPFHFLAPAAALNFGPFLVPPMTVEGVCFEIAGGTLGRISPVVRAFIR